MLINHVEAYAPDNQCCARANDENECLTLTGGPYPIYCPPSTIQTKKDFSPQSLLPLTSDIPSQLELPSGCGAYSHCVGGLDDECPPIGSDQCIPDHCDSFDNCVGAGGVDCDGIELISALNLNVITPVSCGTNCVTLPVSVGSIYHDLCCRNHPHGAFCDDSNYVISDTLNIFGNADNNCACLLEWRKAAWNQLRGRYWTADFSTLDHSSNLNPAPGTRPTWFPTGSGTNYIQATSSILPQEVVATAALCAPAGTELDCPVTSNNEDCKISGFLASKACSPAAYNAGRHGCKKKHKNRWESHHPTAGDAVFCCSTIFEVIRYILPSTRYGICA